MFPENVPKPPDVALISPSIFALFANTSPDRFTLNGAVPSGPSLPDQNTSSVERTGLLIPAV